jgi:hypothetical protein
LRHSRIASSGPTLGTIAYGRTTVFFNYAQRQGIALSTVYFRMKHLGDSIQRHPWFDEITSHLRPLRQAA